MRGAVKELEAFYASPLGRAAAGVLTKRLRRRWPSLATMRVLGLGYAPPLLDALPEGAERVLTAMPGGQGAHRWPAAGRSRCALTEEDALPFPDMAFDRVLLAHDVEVSEHLAGRLREVWRVLAGEGRLIVIAPNRRGLWARFEHTPFGHGRPWSRAQLTRLLGEAMFTPLGVEEALFAPPLRPLFRPGAAEALEGFGRRCLPFLGGVLVAEAGKRLAAATPAPVARRRLLQGVLTPQPSAAARSGPLPSRSAPPCAPDPIHNRADSRSSE